MMLGEAGVVLLVDPGFCGINPEGVARAAESSTSKLCTKKRDTRTSLLEYGSLEENIRAIWNVQKHPDRKEPMETRVVSHAWGFAGRPAVERPRMTVLPGMSESVDAREIPAIKAHQFASQRKLPSWRNLLHRPFQ
jgi:hypothetical protein